MAMVSTGTEYVQGHVSLVGKTSEDRRIMIIIIFFFFFYFTTARVSIRGNTELPT